MRGLDLRHLAPRRERRWRHVLPRLAAVAGHPDQTIVGAGPDEPRHQRGRAHRIDGPALQVGLRQVETADARRRARILAREIRTDDAPVFTAVGRLVKMIGRVVHAVRVLRRKKQGLGAVHADTGAFERDRRDVLHLPRRQMRFRHDIPPGAIDDVGIEGIGYDVPVLDRTDRMPVAKRDLAVVAASGDADRTAFLLARADSIRECVGDADVVELRRRLVEPRAPGRAAVDRDDGTLIADQHDVPGVVRTDPQVLVVIAAGRSSKRRPMGAPVRRLHGHEARAVEHVGVARINLDDRQITAADTQRRPRIAGGAHPRFTAVIRPIDAQARCGTVFTLGARGDRRVQPARAARRHCHVDLRLILGKSLRQLAPMVTAVRGLVESPRRPVKDVLVLPGARAHIPKCGVQYIRIMRIDLDARAAGVVVRVQHPGPMLPAVLRAKNPALRTRAVRVTQNGRIQSVGITRVHRKIRDLLRIVECQVRPSHSRVG